MKEITKAAVTVFLLSGCVANDSLPPISENHIDSSIPTNYPEIRYPKLRVNQDSQMVTASNRLADALGVEFVEWAKEINPYDYYQVRNTTVRLDYENPQAAFLDLFDRSGLLPIYDEFTNTITIYPYSMDQRVNKPHIFTPKFTRSEIQKDEVERAYKETLAKEKKALEFNYYRGFSVRETLSAWAEYSGYSGVVYYFDSRPHRLFFESNLTKSDHSIASNNIEVMHVFIAEEQERQATDLKISITVDKATNKLVFHPFEQGEELKTYEVKKTTVKDNLRQVADSYGYDLVYKATDYRIQAGFTTVLTNYIKPSVKSLVSQYPLDVEAVESSKELIIRGK